MQSSDPCVVNFELDCEYEYENCVDCPIYYEWENKEIEWIVPRKENEE